VRLTCGGRRAKVAGGLLALAWLLGGAALGWAQSPLSAEAIEKMRTKPPEDWTTEERLAVRFDPGDIQRRKKADRQDLKKNAAAFPDLKAEVTGPPSSDTSTSVAGDRNPELFLPIEIFDSLLKGGFPPQVSHQREARDTYRSSLKDGLEAAGFEPESFWKALEAIAKGPIKADKEFCELAQTLGHATPGERKAIVKRCEEIAVSMCAPRASALAEARRRFGRKAFDRFLYRAVAPTMFQLMSPDPEWENQLRKREEGCHAARR
jgi:hypothetical protein